MSDEISILKSISSRFAFTVAICGYLFSGSLIAEGHTSSEIAERLHLAPSTVEVHRRNIMRKLDLHGVAELTKYAIRNGITSA